MTRTLRSARAYAASAARVARRGGFRPLGREERLVFVVGSPRSGTSFTGKALGSQPGFVDLDEVTPLKAALPRLAGAPPAAAAHELRRIVERVRLLGLARGLRAVEQTPETSFALGAALLAYPQATAVHVLRDGRDVVCSLLERGWLRADRGGGDDAGLAYGAHSRFWVEPELREEFEHASEARRAAWAWRRYVTAARRCPSARSSFATRRSSRARRTRRDRIAAALDSEPAPLRRAFGEVHGSSVGRWRRDLSAEQVAEVEAEAGALLGELRYL